MRILMTLRQLITRGGSEMFTIEVATELSRRGHEVAVYCPRIGEWAHILFSSGVWVKERLSELPWTPDIIHGQHHLQAITALSYFETVPAIYYCHGIYPWVEQVPLHPRIRTYVMMCQWMVPPVRTAFGIPSNRIIAIPNFVDTRRFSHVRPPAERLRSAVLFGNHTFPADELQRLEGACSRAGLSLDKIGHAHGNPQPRPEFFLPRYDLVFAIGKCALEAIACGCAVVTIIPGQAGELVTIENLDNWIHSNFSPRYYSCAAQIDDAWLMQELQKYLRESTAQVTARVRSVCDLGQAVDKLERIYRDTVADFDHRTMKVTAELAPYLERLSSEVDAMWEGQHPGNYLGSRLDALAQKIDRLAATFSQELKANRSLGVRLESALRAIYRRVLPEKIRTPLFRFRLRVLEALLR
jgi:hypothetical protein